MDTTSRPDAGALRYFLNTRGEKWFKWAARLAALITFLGLGLFAYDVYVKMTIMTTYYAWDNPLPPPSYFSLWQWVLPMAFGLIGWIALASLRTWLYVTVNSGTVIQHSDYSSYQYGRQYTLLVSGTNRLGLPRSQWHAVNLTTWTTRKDGDEVTFM